MKDCGCGHKNSEHKEGFCTRCLCSKGLMPKHIDSITITIKHDNCTAKLTGFSCDFVHIFNIQTPVADNFTEDIAKAITEVIIKYQNQ